MDNTGRYAGLVPDFEPREAPQSTAGSKSGLIGGLDALSIAKAKLVHQAARCLTVLPLSDHPDDWPSRMPKVALMEIEKQTERLRVTAITLRDIADSI